MRPQTIRVIDRTLGKAVCAGLSAVRNKTAVPSGPPRRILFIKLIEQGATVLAWDAVRRAVEKVGRSNVFFIVFAENRAIIDLLDLVPPNNVIEIRHANFAQFCTDIAMAIRRCRREGIDCTIDMEFYARASAILAFLIGAERRVGLHRFTSEAPYRGDLLTHRLQHSPYLHVATLYSLLVSALDAPASKEPLVKKPTEDFRVDRPRFEATADERTRMEKLLEELAGQPVTGPLILLNPNAGDLLPLRRWPTERFVQLGQRLLQDYPDAVIGITGAPSEQQAADAVAAQIGTPPRVLSLAGRTTLREVVVLYTLAEVLVTNDSGPGHFASMTDIHDVVLFGPETPSLFGPRSPNAHVLWAELACSPCVSVLNHRFSPCTDNICMQTITVDQVHQVVQTCLEER